jgi:hypothetical protein
MSVELRVIVYAEYSYDGIRPRQCLAVKIEDLEGSRSDKGVDTQVSQLIVLHTE